MYRQGQGEPEVAEIKLNTWEKKIMVSHTSSVISEKEREIILTYKRVSDCAIYVLL